MTKHPSAKRTRSNDVSLPVKLTEGELAVVKIQFQLDTRSSFPLSDALVREYYRFIELKLSNPNVVLVPSFLIHKLWQAHILCTGAYAAFCERYNHGQLIEHYPSKKQRQKRYQKTLKTYEDIFGMEPQDRDIWASHYNQRPSRKRVQELKMEANAEAQLFKQKAQEDQKARKRVRLEGSDDDDDEMSIPTEVFVKQDSKAAKELRQIELESSEEEDSHVDYDSDLYSQTTTEQDGGDEDTEDEDTEEEDYFDADLYTVEQREYLRNNSAKGRTEEDLIEWHEDIVVYLAKEAGYDVKECPQCDQGHFWIKGGFDLDCDSCRDASERIGDIAFV